MPVSRFIDPDGTLHRFPAITDVLPLLGRNQQYWNEGLGNGFGLIDYCDAKGQLLSRLQLTCADGFGFHLYYEDFTEGNKIATPYFSSNGSSDTRVVRLELQNPIYLPAFAFLSPDDAERSLITFFDSGKRDERTKWLRGAEFRWDIVLGKTTD